MITLLTWILNLIFQFISCLQTELAIVKVSHRIRGCVIRKYSSQRTHLDMVQFLPVIVILFSGFLNFF